MTLEVLEYTSVADPICEWNKIVEESKDAWIWATHLDYEFRIAVLKASNRFVCDISFFVAENGEICGFAPLVMIRSELFDGIQASYDKPLPWPIIKSNVKNKIKIENYIFDEIEKRVINSGAGMLSLHNSPPNTGGYLDISFYQTIRQRGFIDNSYLSHYLPVTHSSLEIVRPRYKQYARKLLNNYEFKIIDKHNYNLFPGLAEEYMELHVKDAGGIYRPIETYTLQVGIVSKSDSFMIQARNKAVNKVVGMLLIYVHKKAAYDASVAVDPDFQNDRVSLLMKWETIKHLQDLGIDHYELGPAALSPTFMWQPSEKNYGISFFKQGWCQGMYKKIFQAEKFYSKKAIESFWEKKLESLVSYYNLD